MSYQEATARVRDPAAPVKPVPERVTRHARSSERVSRFPGPPAGNPQKINWSGGLFSLGFTLAIAGLLAWGWSQRDEYWFSAEKGFGYAFGIVGASLMLLLLVYPLRKHWKPMRRVLPISYWFRLHMMLGVIGPVFILYHCNFRLGSLNSNVALFSMLLVAGSGVVGRYVYRQIHRGLYGARIRFGDLRADYDRSGGTISGNALVDDQTAARMREIESSLVDRTPSLIVCLRARYSVRKLRRKIADRLERARRSRSVGPEQIHAFHGAYAGWRISAGGLERMARYALFARLFSLWHVFHLPIFFMMLVAALVHVVVVHMY